MNSGTPAEFYLCPQCGRAVPAQLGERYCPNDGLPLLRACPVCHAAIRSPYARYCAQCGHHLHQPAPAKEEEG